MALDTKEKSIGTRTYSCTQLPAMRSLKLLTRFGKIVGPALAKLKGGLSGDIGDAAAALFDRLGEADVEYLLKQLFESVTVTENMKQRPMLVGFDVEYADKLGEVLEVARFCIETQWGPTFGALVSAISAPLPPAEAEESK